MRGFLDGSLDVDISCRQPPAYLMATRMTDASGSLCGFLPPNICRSWGDDGGGLLEKWTPFGFEVHIIRRRRHVMSSVMLKMALITTLNEVSRRGCLQRAVVMLANLNHANHGMYTQLLCRTGLRKLLVHDTGARENGGKLI